MAIDPVIAFVIFVMLITAGFTVGLWLPLIPEIRLLLKAAPAIDAETVQGANSSTTFAVFRGEPGKGGNGDKVIIVHFLRQFADDVETRIRNGVWRSAVVPALVLVYFVLFQFPSAAAAQKMPATSLTAADAVDYSNLRVLTSIGLGIFLAESGYLVAQLRRLIAKYKTALGN